MHENADLALDTLPALPQSERLKQLAPRLWQTEGVVAIWVAGSLATGQADLYSDVDVYVAVTPETADGWHDPDFDFLFDGQCLARQFSRFGADLLVHHILLASGEVFDLHVQRGDARVGPADRLILGCRDPRLKDDPEQYRGEKTFEFPADGESIQQLIEMYWYEVHKCRKVLHRSLDLVAIVELRLLHLWYMRLSYILATEQDCLDLRRATIHGLTPVARALHQAFGDRVWQVVGLPVRAREEVVAALETLNSEMARLGRELASKHGFRYPEELEAVVIRSWANFKQAEGL